MKGPEALARAAVFRSDPTDPRHATINGYSNLKCRCERCRTAWATEIRTRTEARAARPIPTHVHGTENGYGNYRCRCRLCTDAWATASAKRAARRRNKAIHQKKGARP